MAGAGATAVEVESHVTCPVCRSRSRRCWIAGGGRAHRCAQCGLEWFNPSTYPADHADQYLRDATSPTAYYGLTAACDREAFDGRMRTLIEMSGLACGRVLDIGSSVGTFLEVAAEHGWRAVGVEPNPKAAAIARAKGLTVRTAFFDRHLASELGEFDAVHLSDVIEHVFDPVGLLHAATRALVPGGVLLVTTPDFDTLTGRMLQRKPKEHVVHFRRRSLAAAVTRAGFEVTGIERTSRPRSIAAMRYSTTVGPLGRALLRLVSHPHATRALERLLAPCFRDTLLLSARRPQVLSRTA